MTVTERLDKHDRQIASMRDLVKEGMKMVVEIRNLTLETRKDLRKLAAMQLATGEAQKRTDASRSEEHTSELQSLRHLVCRLLLEKKKIQKNNMNETQNPHQTMTPSCAEVRS